MLRDKVREGRVIDFKSGHLANRTEMLSSSQIWCEQPLMEQRVPVIPPVPKQSNSLKLVPRQEKTSTKFIDARRNLDYNLRSYAAQKKPTFGLSKSLKMMCDVRVLKGNFAIQSLCPLLISFPK